VFRLLRVAIIREHIIQRMYKVLKYIVAIDKWYRHSNLIIANNINKSKVQTL